MSLDELKSARVEHLGRAPQLRGQGWSLIGQDGGQSIALGDRRLFVFADTLLASSSLPAGEAGRPARLSPEEHLFLGNTAGWTRASTLAGAMGDLDYYLDPAGRPREVLPGEGLEPMMGVRLWPQHGVEVDGTVFLYYLGIQHLDPGTWGFRLLGNGLAKLDPSSGESERVRVGDEWCLWPSRDDDLHFGVHVLVEGDRAYVFGSRTRRGENRGLLARAETSRLAEPEAYEYLTGNRAGDATWSPQPDPGFDLGPSGGDYSVSYNRYLERYLMVFVDGFEKRLCVRTSKKIWGPYGPSQRIGDPLPHEPDSEMITLGLEHPSFAEDEGRTISVSYCEPHFIQNSILRVRLG